MSALLILVSVCHTGGREMLSIAKRILKAALLPGIRPRKILFGAGRGIVLCANPKDSAQRYFGLEELEIAKEFVNFAKRSKSFCDIGASDGWYCLLARKHNPVLQMVALEPQPRSSALTNLRVNHLDGDPTFQWIEARCGSTGRRLDDVLAGLPQPILLKMDIEGGELDALSTGIRTLRESECVLIVETHSRELEEKCIELLQSINYRVKVIPNGWYRSLIHEQRPAAHNRWFRAVRAHGT